MGQCSKVQLLDYIIVSTMKVPTLRVSTYILDVPKYAHNCLDACLKGAADLVHSCALFFWPLLMKIEVLCTHFLSIKVICPPSFGKLPPPLPEV